MIKKGISILLVVLFLLSFLSACGGKNAQAPSANDSGTTTATTAAVTTTVATTAAAATTSAKEENKDVTVAETEVSKDAPITITVMMPQSDTNFPREQTPTYILTQKLALTYFNIDYQYELVFPAEYETQVSTRLASGGNMPDLIYFAFTQNRLIELYKNGLILRLNDLIESNGPNVKALLDIRPFLAVAHGDAEGNILRLPQNYVENPQHRIRVMHIRNDWLKAIGTDYTKMLTPDDFYNALKAFQEQDVNGTGKNDTIVWGNVFQIGQSFGNAFGAFNINPDRRSEESWHVDKSGKVYNSLVTSEAYDYISFMNRLYKEDMLFPGFSNWTSEQYNEQLLNNRIAARYGPWWESIVASPRVRDQGFKDAEYVPLGRPMSNTDKPSMVLINLTGGGGIMISSNCPHPEAAMTIIDWGYGLQGSVLSYYGVEDINVGNEYHVKAVDREGLHLADYTMTSTDLFESEIEKEPLLRDKLGVNCGPVIPHVLIGTGDDVALDLWDFSGPRSGIAGTIQFNVQGLKDATDNYGIPQSVFAAPSDEQASEWLELSDLWLYMDETINRFVSGEEPLSNWNSFVDSAMSMGLDKATAIRQARYDAGKAILGN